MERGKRVVWEDEEDDEPVQIGGSNDHTDGSAAMCLIGKLWTERSYNTFALMETMKKLWNPAKGMTCRDLGSNMIVFQFNSMRDMKKVKDMEPWHFNKHVLVLKHITNDIQPSAMKFTETPMWIRIYDLPISGRDIATLKQIGRRVGEVLDIDKVTTTGLTKSVRLKIEIQMEKPLKRGIKVRIGTSEPIWLPVTYERLPSFCYCCGKLGHTHKDCEQLEEKEDEISEEELPYGDFMRASPMKSTVIMPEQKEKSRDGLIKSLFANRKEEMVQQSTRDLEFDKEDQREEMEEKVSKLLSNLEKVKVGTGKKEEQTNALDKPVVENTQTTIPVRLKQTQNILHPTTKTLSPNPTCQNTTNTKNTRPLSDPITSNTQMATPNPTENPTASMHDKATVNLPPKYKLPIDTQPHLFLPTLTPIAELRNMIYNKKPIPSTPQNQPPSTPHPITSSQTSNKANRENEPSGNTKPRTWNRLILKKPKVEGDIVVMGKRISEYGGITPNFGNSGKRSRGGPENTSSETAKADSQPRRSP